MNELEVNDAHPDVQVFMINTGLVFTRTVTSLPSNRIKNMYVYHIVCDSMDPMSAEPTVYELQSTQLPQRTSIRTEGTCCDQ